MGLRIGITSPPAVCTLAVVLLAELHGRCGYFPAHLRLRPVEGPDGSPRLPPQYEVAEILDLQAIRDDARRKR
jgi:hypothetical protein